MSDDLSLVIERIFDAPRPLVFEAWIKPEHAEKWFVPKGFTVRLFKGEPRPGGAWECHMISPSGEEHKEYGVYREIVPNELLVFTQGWEGDDGKMEHETVVTVRFSDVNGGKTRMNFEQAIFRSVESRNSHNEGWSECFDKLGGHLAEIGRRNS